MPAFLGKDIYLELICMTLFCVNAIEWKRADTIHINENGDENGWMLGQAPWSQSFGSGLFLLRILEVRHREKKEHQKPGGMNPRLPCFVQ